MSLRTRDFQRERVFTQPIEMKRMPKPKKRKKPEDTPPPPLITLAALFDEGRVGSVAGDGRWEILPPLK